MLWSIASGAQFFVKDRAGFWACRFLIGIFMGGFIPDSILYLSYFYKKSEMPIRLAFFWFVDSMSGVVAGFIAYGVLHMRGVAGKVHAELKSLAYSIADTIIARMGVAIPPRSNY
jgi:MFS family permease